MYLSVKSKSTHYEEMLLVVLHYIVLLYYLFISLTNICKSILTLCLVNVEPILDTLGRVSTVSYYKSVS